MFNPKFRFTHDEVRIIVLALVELKNQLIYIPVLHAGGLGDGAYRCIGYAVQR